MYAYCENNPVIRVDPTGEWFLTFLISIAVSVFVAANVASVITSNIDVSDETIEPMTKETYSSGEVCI